MKFELEVTKNGFICGKGKTPHYLYLEDLTALKKAVTNTLAEYKTRGLTNDKLKLKNKQKESRQLASISDVREVFEAWQKEFSHPKSKLDVRRKHRITARLKDGYSKDELILALTGVKRSPWHMGQNPTNTIYDKIDTVFRDADQVDMFLALAKKKLTAPTDTNKCQFCEWHKQKPTITPCQIHNQAGYREYQERKHAQTTQNIPT